MPKNLPPTSKASLIRNQKLFFWCCKPLGLQTLWQLAALRHTRFPKLQLVGIGVSSKDSMAAEIIRVARAHWPGCVIHYDEFELNSQHQYDLGLCIGFPHKISQSTLNQFQNGVVNLHFAPLPQYRGSGTLEHAILRSDDRYGLTLHFMDEGLDTGDIITRAWCPLPSDATYQNMLPVLETLGLSLMKEWLPRLITKHIEATSQEILIQQEGIEPLFCTRKSVAKLYALNRSRSFSSLWRYVRALDKGPGKRPYFEHAGHKLYLSVSDR